jgi:hypothetical protein
VKNLSEKIDNRGYGRHFSHLQKEKILLPPIATQAYLVNMIKKFGDQVNQILEI